MPIYTGKAPSGLIKEKRPISMVTKMDKSGITFYVEAILKINLQN
jgi:hypothetical protein